MMNVWGVRTIENNIALKSKGYLLNAEHAFPDLRVMGQVDKASYDLIVGIHQALPPESNVDYQDLEVVSPEVQRSARIVETGIAALTQLNPGTLTISETQFILKGTVFSEDRKRTIEELINVRRAEIEPLEIVVNISVESLGITQACRNGIDHVLANNVLNYAVNHYKIREKHLSVLRPMANTILGVCQGQIAKVLVEGHADYTGGVGYNQGLSERRSGTAKDYLIEQGISPQMINAFGYGEFRPIASNESVEGRTKNRRTEIYLLIQDQMTDDTVPAVSLIKD
jgi:outer membrane protein OmpA-like peptidoglycan-associated protein